MPERNRGSAVSPRYIGVLPILSGRVESHGLGSVPSTDTGGGMNRRRRVVIALAGLGVVMVTSLIPANSASAVTTSALKVSRLNGAWQDVVTFDAALTSGWRMYFAGKLSATRLISQNVLQAIRVRCTSGSSSMTSVMSTVNNVVDSSAAQAVSIRALLTVPASGTYRCALQGRGARVNVSSTVDVLQVTAGSSSTYLGMTDASQSGAAEWTDSTDIVVSPGSSAYVLRQTWTASATAETVSLRADPELNEEDVSLDAIVTGTLVVTPVDSANQACGQSIPFTPVTLRITHNMHHAKMYLNQTVNLAGLCSRRLTMKVLISAQSGYSPVRVYNGLYSNGIALNGTPTF